MLVWILISFFFSPFIGVWSRKLKSASKDGFDLNLVWWMSARKKKLAILRFLFLCFVKFMVRWKWRIRGYSVLTSKTSMKHVKVQWNIVLFSYYVFLLMQEFDHLTCFKKTINCDGSKPCQWCLSYIFVASSDSFSIKGQNHEQLLAPDDYLALNYVLIGSSNRPLNWISQPYII